MDAFDEQLNNERRLITCQPQPARWKAFADAYALDWQIVPFRRGGSAIVPQVAGFYCFIVANDFERLPAVAYPLYAGETEHLRRRYQEYVTEWKSPTGRFHIRKFLRVFAGELSFCFAPFAAEKPELRAIEKQLNDALMPHYSHKDFSAEVKAQKVAWP